MLKKFVSLILALLMLMSMCVSVSAARFEAVDKFEVESLEVAKNQGEYVTVESEILSGGKGVVLKSEKIDDWVFNDYVRFYVPIYQNAVYNIKVGYKKGPDCGIAQLWFSDINTRIGEKVDLYSEKEEVVEVDLGNWPCNISSKRWFEFRVDGKNPKSSGADIVVDYIIVSYAEEYSAIGSEVPYLKGEAPKANGDEPYVWDQVMEGGTGSSTHVVFHPTEKGLVYMGTDMGGMYRWDNENYTWKNITDVFEEEKMRDYIGIDGIALDPTNPDIVYAAVGMSPDKDESYMGAVIKSYDRGETWIETGFEAFFGANYDFRNNGECIAVDPANPNNVWVATLTKGLFKSTDGFKTWEEVNLPVTLEKNKVFPRIITFDENSKTEKGCTKIYLGIIGAGIYVTNDGGASWDKLETPFELTSPTKIKFANDGSILVPAGVEGLYKLKNGEWTNIAPVEGANFTQAAMDKNNSDYIITTWYKGPVGSYGQYVYYTLDGGKNWRMINDDMVKNHYVPRLEWGGFFCNVTEIAIDPYNPARVFMTGWSNFYMTEDIFAEKPIWTNYTRGVEHGCVASMISMPTGARLMVGAYDYLGGRFTDVTQYMNEMLPPKEANPSRMDFCENDPNFIVRVAKGYGLYSTDNGINWKYFENYPAKKDVMAVAVSSDINPETGYPSIVVTAGGSIPQVSLDGGKTWAECRGAEKIDISSKWTRLKRMAADKTEPEVIYYLTNKALFRSSDYGVTFEKVQDFESASMLETSFGSTAALYVSAGGKLLCSTDKGESFKEVGNFTAVEDVTFGKEISTGAPATIYVLGNNSEGVRGVYRSTDNGKNWIQIYNDITAKEKLAIVNILEGDRQTFGVVYAGSGGRGVKYGVPADSENIFYTNKDDEVKVMINNQLCIFDVEPKLINDRTMVPMRKIFEDVGAKVDWDEATQTVTATRTVSDSYGVETTEVKLTIGSKKITINGVESEMDVEAVETGGRTLVPVRFIAEALGAKVEWSEGQNLVKIII